MQKMSTNTENIHLTKKNYKAQFAANLLAHAGITLNGDAPFDIHVHNPTFYTRVFREGPLALGETYMDKWWDCDQLDVFFDKVLCARLDTKINASWHYYFLKWISKFINFQTRARATQVAEKHYDLGNDLFAAMLDKQMIYSCAYWKDAHDLDAAQIAKLDLICRKLYLQPGMRVLDIGCGWGGLAKYAAQQFGVEVVGITISKQQADYAKKNCVQLPIEIRMQDYRDVHETFDRIVSVGMFEHVGHMNYPVFMQTVHRALKDDGLFLLHTIGSNETSVFSNEWITKYIFPNGVLPSAAQIAQSSEKLFIMEDWHNFGADYDKTLIAWFQRFTAHWQQLKSHYDERFYRMWAYYLHSCAGSFRARTNQLWQVVFSKYGVRHGYQSIR